MQPHPDLVAHFANAVNDAQYLDFMQWLVARDLKVVEVCDHAAPGANFRLVDFTDPGWVQLWEQDATVETCMAALVALDFDFESFWELWTAKENHP